MAGCRHILTVLHVSADFIIRSQQSYDMFINRSVKLYGYTVFFQITAALLLIASLKNYPPPSPSENI